MSPSTVSLRPALLALLAGSLLAGCPEEESEPAQPAGEDADTAEAADARPDTQPHETIAPDDTATDEGPLSTEDQDKILAVAATETWAFPGRLENEVHVVRTEMGVPHLYARTRTDLAFVLGLVVARDRYFVMDLQRRLGLGTLSELLGDGALQHDLEARQTGMTFVADRLCEHLSPEMGAYVDAFAAGVNAYIDALKAGDARVAAPSELEVAGPFLGQDEPAALMAPWDRRSVCGMVSVVMYETTFEGGDVGRTKNAKALETTYADGPYAELRKKAYIGEVWNDVTPMFEASSTAGWGVETAGSPRGSSKPGPHDSTKPANRPASAPALPAAQLAQLAARLDAFGLMLGRNFPAGFGSNAWAVAGSKAKDGAALVAGDGHLQLSVPALMYQVGLDTAVFGGGDTRQAGLLMTGLPILAVGTNGLVGWSQVNPVTDTTDWYAEEVKLDAAGKPESTRFGGEWKPLLEVVEELVVADVPVLGSVGRTEKWPRWTTFDGRWVASIEGKKVSASYEPKAGESVANFRGDLYVLGDANGDGKVAAVSFDYAAFDTTRYVETLDRFGFAANVEELRQQTRGLVGSALFTTAADAHGDILYSSYQAVPCRGYLDRDESGAWLPGADPTMLLDGTKYGGFQLPSDEKGYADETPGKTDPYRCVVPFDETPQAVSPKAGFVFTANNDPGHITSDGSLENDPWYIGGPWAEVRAHTIMRELEKTTAAGEADVAAMAAIQANADSRMGESFAPALMEAIDTAKALSEDGGAKEDHEQRLADLYAGRAAALDEVRSRLQSWADRGYETPSGVETFYHTPHGAEELDDSVATTIFNAWFGPAIARIWNDEGVPYKFSSSHTQVRATHRYLAGRGAGNPKGHLAWLEETGEAIFFDDRNTPDVLERSREVLLGALVGALDFLESAPTSPGAGGFGTKDMSKWLWGLRHRAKFESLLAGFLGDDPAFAFLADMFAITTDTLPLADELPAGDPRKGIKWFPRGGDQWSVDAANPGMSGQSFDHGAGPVMRMVIALKDGQVAGQNIIPGGQSGIAGSPHFADQVKLWLANDTVPLCFHVADVVAGAAGREVHGP